MTNCFIVLSPLKVAVYCRQRPARMPVCLPVLQCCLWRPITNQKSRSQHRTNTQGKNLRHNQRRVNALLPLICQSTMVAIPITSLTTKHRARVPAVSYIEAYPTPAR